MATIKQDLTALKTSAETWYDEYEKEISALDSRTNADLYTSLGQLFEFHKTWTKDDDKKAEYKKLFDNTYITKGGKEAGTGYAKVRDQVRLNPAFTKGGVGRTIFVNKRLEREIAQYLAALSALSFRRRRVLSPSTI